MEFGVRDRLLGSEETEQLRRINGRQASPRKDLARCTVSEDCSFQDPPMFQTRFAEAIDLPMEDHRAPIATRFHASTVPGSEEDLQV